MLSAVFQKQGGEMGNINKKEKSENAENYQVDYREDMHEK